MSDLINEEDLELQIRNAEDLDQLREIDRLFKLTRLKKEMLRLGKYEKLQDKIVDTAVERVTLGTSYIRNDELLNFLKATQVSLDRAQRIIEETGEQIQSAPVINNTLNVTYIDSADRESRERIQQAVLGFLNQVETLEEEATASVKEDIEVTKEKLLQIEQNEDGYNEYNTNYLEGDEE